MKLSIITPSFRNSEWLRLCVASVADQEGVEFEHIVQDSCSDDGTQEWLAADRRVKAYIEKDQGMYDAVNRGFRRASGEVLAYLNCDEQYLPDALKAVHDFFLKHPQIDVVLSDSIITDRSGDYICHRLSLVPRCYQMWVRFPALTCALFIRRRVLQELGIYFDTKWKDLGDWFWVMEMCKRGVKVGVLPVLTSIFTDTGENMNLKPNALRERRIKWQMAPRWVKLLSLPLVLQYRLRLALRGGMFRRPFSYALYTLGSPSQRVVRQASKPTSFWGRPGGLPPEPITESGATSSGPLGG